MSNQILSKCQDFWHFLCYNQDITLSLGGGELALRIFAVLTSLGSYLMLLMGAIVTKTGSGEGCGHTWPFCHGELIPQTITVAKAIEYSHRMVAGMVGLLILVLAVWVWRRCQGDRLLMWLAGLSLFFVIFQGILGALTVVFREVLAHKTALSLHFGFSLISFASVVILTMFLFRRYPGQLPQVGRWFPYTLWGILAYTYVVVYTGALVRHTGATMGCGAQFPLCNGVWLPPFNSLAGFQMMHRFAAFLLLGMMITLFGVVYRRLKWQPLVKLLLGATLLLIVQAISGVVTILTEGQLLAALLHTTIVSLFFAWVGYICLLVLPPSITTNKGVTNVFT